MTLELHTLSKSRHWYSCTVFRLVQLIIFQAVDSVVLLIKVFVGLTISWLPLTVSVETCFLLAHWVHIHGVSFQRL